MARKYRDGDEPVPGYKLAGFLGRGGFGEVWRAIAPGGTRVALKLIQLAGREGQKELGAIRLVKLVRHPNLVPILAFWLRDADGKVLDDDGFLKSTSADAETPHEVILAMGLGDQNLSDRLNQCRQQGYKGIPPTELVGYLEDAARALDHLNSPLHDLGNGPVAIQHCDVKPQNIMIVSGAAQVCDFGLARAMEDIRTTSAAGSPAYAAPEVIDESRPSHSTDQYSLAISYVELRTGRLPFANQESFIAVINAHLQGKLDLSGLPPAEQAVIRKATARDPKQRYPTCLQMVRDLGRAATGELDAQQVLGAAKAGDTVAFDQTAIFDPATMKVEQRAAGLATAGGDTPLDVTRMAPGETALPAATRISLAPNAEVLQELVAREPRRLGVAVWIGLAIAVLALVGGGWFALQQTTAVAVSRPEIAVPVHYVPAAGAEVVTVGRQQYWNKLVHAKLGDQVEFVLIPRVRREDPETFYLLKNKVSVALYRQFATAQPTGTVDNSWQLGPLVAGQDLGTSDATLPVYRVHAGEAHTFAVWLGGRLPTVAQWDKASGMFEPKAGEGPFVSPWDPTDKQQIAVNRPGEGPLPGGTATHDLVKLFGVHDFAGNGLEWTRNVLGLDQRFVPLAKPTDDEVVAVRSRSYTYPSPLRYADLQDADLLAAESKTYLTREPDLSFRVVLEPQE